MDAMHPPTPRLLATFSSRSAAERGASRVRAVVRTSRVAIDRDDDRLDALIAGQRREMDELVLSGPVPMSGPEARGSFVWAIGGAAVGAIVGAVIGSLVRVDPAPQWVMIMAATLAGALAFGAAAFVYGGGHQPNIEGEVRSTAADVVVGVSASPGDVGTVQQLLVEAGAVDVVRGDLQPERPAEHIETPPIRGRSESTRTWSGEQAPETDPRWGSADG
jgi:hypothetical protein